MSEILTRFDHPSGFTHWHGTPEQWESHLQAELEKMDNNEPTQGLHGNLTTRKRDTYHRVFIEGIEMQKKRDRSACWCGWLQLSSDDEAYDQWVDQQAALYEAKKAQEMAESVATCAGCFERADNCACDEQASEWLNDPAYVQADKADRIEMGMEA